MLTSQLCGENNPEKSSFALDLENTVVVIAPMIPWSIAGAVPLAAIGAPNISIAVAFYLYLLPLGTGCASVQVGSVFTVRSFTQRYFL